MGRREACGCETIEVSSHASESTVRIVNEVCDDVMHQLGMVWPTQTSKLSAVRVGDQWLRTIDGYIAGEPIVGRCVYGETILHRDADGKFTIIDGCVLDAASPKAEHSTNRAVAMTSPESYVAIGAPLPGQPWWPGAQNIGKTSQASDNHTVDELKDVEDKVLAALGDWPRWYKAVAFKYLYALGLRMADVDEVIRRRAK